MNRLFTRLLFGVMILTGTLRAQERGAESIQPSSPTSQHVHQSADDPPEILSVRRPMAFPKSSESVMVTFVCRQSSNPLDASTAKICFSVDGKAAECVDATVADDTTFTAAIPPQKAESIVTYWATIADSKGNGQISPGDTASFKYFYVVIDNRVAIYDVQFTPNLNGTSGVVGFEVEVGGTVVADTSDLPGDPNAIGGAEPMLVLQESGGAWGGISIRAKDSNGQPIPAICALQRGNRVLLRGTVEEFFGMTVLQNATVVDQQSTGPIPSPIFLTTAQIGTGDSTKYREAEKWESMLAQYQDVVVTDIAPDGSNTGEYMIANTDQKEDQTTWTRVETDNSNSGYTTRTPNTGEQKIVAGNYFLAITGVMTYVNDNFKLIPRKQDDYLTSGLSVPQSAIASHRMVISPNPISGASSLQLMLPTDAVVTVEILDALGKQLSPPIAATELPQGTHRLELPTGQLPSGTAFVRVIANEVVATLPVVVVR